MKVSRKDAEELLARHKIDLKTNKEMWLNDTRSWKSYDKIKKELEQKINALEAVLGGN